MAVSSNFSTWLTRAQKTDSLEASAQETSSRLKRATHFLVGGLALLAPRCVSSDLMSPTMKAPLVASVLTGSSLVDAVCWCQKELTRVVSQPDGSSEQQTHFLNVGCYDNDLYNECREVDVEARDFVNAVMTYADGSYFDPLQEANAANITRVDDEKKKVRAHLAHLRAALSNAVEQRPRLDCNSGYFTNWPYPDDSVTMPTLSGNDGGWNPEILQNNGLCYSKQIREQLGDAKQGKKGYETSDTKRLGQNNTSSSEQTYFDRYNSILDYRFLEKDSPNVNYNNSEVGWLVSFSPHYEGFSNYTAALMESLIQSVVLLAPGDFELTDLIFERCMLEGPHVLFPVYNGHQGNTSTFEIGAAEKPCLPIDATVLVRTDAGFTQKLLGALKVDDLVVTDASESGEINLSPVTNFAHREDRPVSFVRIAYQAADGDVFSIRGSANHNLPIGLWDERQGQVVEVNTSFAKAQDLSKSRQVFLKLGGGHDHWVRVQSFDRVEVPGFVAPITAKGSIALLDDHMAENGAGGEAITADEVSDVLKTRAIQTSCYSSVPDEVGSLINWARVTAARYLPAALLPNCISDTFINKNGLCADDFGDIAGRIGEYFYPEGYV